MKALGWLAAAVIGFSGTLRVGAGSDSGISYRPDLLVQIGVSDLDRAVAFYTTTLGFELTERREDLGFVHIRSNVPGLELGLSRETAPQGSGSIVLNLGVEHVARARATLEARGVAFRGATHVIPGKVALATFADPDGNVLRLAGPPDSAASR